jgi:hypothetical protein
MKIGAQKSLRGHSPIRASQVSGIKSPTSGTSINLLDPLLLKMHRIQKILSALHLFLILKNQNIVKIEKAVISF